MYVGSRKSVLIVHVDSTWSLHVGTGNPRQSHVTARVRVSLPNVPVGLTQNHYPALCLLQSSYKKTLSVKVSPNCNPNKSFMIDFLILASLLRYSTYSCNISTMR